MKAPLFPNLRRSATALLLAASFLVAGAALPAQPSVDNALAAGQTITPANNCSGSTCG